MHYLIDGYNFLFRLMESRRPLQTTRQLMVRSLQIEFKKFGLKGTIVFDGRHQRDEQSGLSYHSPLVIAYSHSGQTADQYILEQLENSILASHATVVTDDRFLSSSAKGLGAKTLSLQAFLALLEKKHARKIQQREELRDQRPFRETKHHTERLIRIFEEKLKNPEDDD